MVILVVIVTSNYVIRRYYQRVSDNFESGAYDDDPDKKNDILNILINSFKVFKVIHIVYLIVKLFPLGFFLYYLC